jgi:hypothetical protein
MFKTLRRRGAIAAKIVRKKLQIKILVKFFDIHFQATTGGRKCDKHLLASAYFGA